MEPIINYVDHLADEQLLSLYSVRYIVDEILLPQYDQRIKSVHIHRVIRHVLSLHSK